MASVYPFRGLRYTPGVVPIEQVVTQPYDKISKAMQDRYYAMNPHNIIRIILGRAEPGDSAENNVYTRAASTLQEWRGAGVLTPLTTPSFFVYFQQFTIPGTTERQIRKGFIGAGRLEDYANQIIFPHERTLTGPKQDRLQLLRHTRTHFEQIFMLYEDPARRIDKVLDEVAAGPPAIEVTDEYGVIHTLWVVDGSEAVELIQREMADKRMIIADGHHRYETALAYRDERRDERLKEKQDGQSALYERMAMTFFNMDSPGLTILPTHRVVSRLVDFRSAAVLERAAAFFDIEEAPAAAEPFRIALKNAGKRGIAIGVSTDGGSRQVLLRLKASLDLAQAMPDLSASQRTLDVVVLHRLVIEKCLGIGEDAVRRESNITYFRGFDSALEPVRAGAAQIAFLLNPTAMEQMRNIAYEGHVMPQKSTDFYPKVLSGLVMYSLDEV